MNKQRYLLVVSGPSGAGKDTVVSRMMQKHPEIEISVSATTRAPRAVRRMVKIIIFLPMSSLRKKSTGARCWNM